MLTGISAAIVAGPMPTVCADCKRAVRRECGKQGGRPRRYDLAGFRIGQSVTIPWRVGFNGERLENQKALHLAVQREGRRLGHKFSKIGRAMGLLVTRIE